MGLISGNRLAALLPAWRGQRPSSPELAAAMRLLLLDGRLPPGTRLPSERELAAATGTSRTLATAAYDRLREAGLLDSRRGAGSWTTLPGALARRGSFAPSAETGLVDLAHAAPAALPAVADALDAVRPAFAAELGGHGYSPQGLPELRRRIAERFTARGLPTTTDQVMVTSGAQHATALALRTLLAPGERVLVEHPSYPNALDAVRAAHALPVPVPLDPDEGWDLEAVAAALRQSAPRLAYLVIDFHNPTGLRMPAAERRRLAGLLRAARTITIVDETLVELDLDGGEPPPPLATELGEHAITVGSVSKTLWGGLRVGWLRAAGELVTRLIAARPATDLGTPVLEQLVTAELLADPDPLITERHEQLRASRAALVATLAEHCPGWRARVPGGGLSLWCELDAAVSGRLVVAAEGHGLRLVPGSRFGVTGGLERWLRLPYTLPTEVLRAAVPRLALARAAVVGRNDDGQGQPPVT